MGNIITGREPANSDPDSAYKRQNEAAAKNPMYQFISIDKPGKLLNDLKSGEDKVIETIKKEIESQYLYRRGKGSIITKKQYVKWFKTAMEDKDEAVLKDEDLENFKIDKFSSFEQHEACWDLNKRGGVGETPFLLCFLMNTTEHMTVGRIFLSLYPKMSLDVYEGKEYFGESGLHLAIVNNDIDSVKLLIDHGANVNQKATGSFFLPNDVKHGTNPLNTNYEGYAYYGEYPLAFAACLNHQEIYDYLIDKGGDPNKQDSFGNMVLHMLVIVNQPKMYKYAVKHHKLKANKDVSNNAKFTPLTLASKLGRHQIFLDMLELDSREMWNYSNIKCSMYPLEALDSIDKEGKANWKSALMIIVDGETDEHLEMLQSGVMRQLLDEKWKTFARRRFLVRLLIAILHLSMISVCVYTRPVRQRLLQYSSPIDITRFIFEILTCLLCLFSLLVEVKEIGGLGVLPFIKNFQHAPDQGIYLLACLLIILCIPFRFAEISDVEDTLLTIAVPGAFTYLLFFARITRNTGPFVTMLYQMCLKDIRRFGIVYFIFLVGFAQGFFFLFRDIISDNTEVLKFSTPWDTVMNLFQMTLGEFQYETFNYARYVGLTKFVFLIFMILVPILLLNMLIAMMGNTYHNMIAKSEKEWRRQWAKIVLVLERGFFKEQLLKYQEEYSESFSDSDKRVLIVIKASNQSNAKQSKAAKLHWKKAVKSVIMQLDLHKRKETKKTFHLKKHKRKYTKEFQRNNAAFVEDDLVMTAMVEQIAFATDDGIKDERAKISPSKATVGSFLPPISPNLSGLIQHTQSSHSTKPTKSVLDNRIYPIEVTISHSSPPGVGSKDQNEGYCGATNLPTAAGSEESPENVGITNWMEEDKEHRRSKKKKKSKKCKKELSKFILDDDEDDQENNQSIT